VATGKLAEAGILCVLVMGVGAGAPGVTPGLDPYSRGYAGAAASSDFFGGVVPGNVLSSLGKAMNLEGAAGLAMKRLAREGLAWVPTAGNICTLLAFGICVHLNWYMTGRGRGQ
jgi:hypothetical protein